MSGVLETFQSEPVALRAVRGEWENFQIVVQAGNEPLPQIEVTTSDLQHYNGPTINATNIHLFWENYVYVPNPSGNRRLQKLWWPDALIPPGLQTTTSLAPRKSRVLWVNVRVPENALPGDYQGQILIRANQETKLIPVRLQVENIVPPTPTMRANVAVYYDVLREWHTKNARALSDTEFAVLKKNYYDFLLDYRINAYDLPVDWKDEEAQKYLRDSRVLSVRTPPLDRADFNDALVAFKKANALKKAYYYWIDEPQPEQYEAVKSATKRLRKLGIKHCVTAHPNQTLKDAVDIWCPNIGNFFGLKHLDLTSLAIERANGHENWLYTMAWPRYPYPTWLLDDDSIAIRHYSWLWAQNNITGFVYSMAHGWGPKPLENLQSFGETNGDGTLLYPAAALNKEDLYPLPSIRLMLLRDAIEDYELTVQLPGNWIDLNLLYAPAIKLPQNLPYVEPLTLTDLLNYRRVTSADIQNRRSLLFLFLKALENNTENLVFMQSFSTFSNFYEEKIPQSISPLIDGRLNDRTWTHKALRPGKLYRQPDETPPVSTQVWLAHKNNSLFVAARCALMPRSSKTEVKGEWLAVDLAPNEADVRWRFIITPAGRGIIEKHTPEGHFRMEGIKWKFAAKASRDFYNVEMQIPLYEIGLKNKFRFSARRRFHDTQLDIHYLLNAFQDAEAVTLMPLIELEP